jgi:hypothetical protein
MPIVDIGCMAFRVNRTPDEKGQTNISLSPIYWFASPDQNQMREKLINAVCLDGRGVGDALHPSQVTDEMLQEYLSRNKIEIHSIYAEF